MPAIQDTKRLLDKVQVKKDYNLISLPTISLPPEEASAFIDYLVDQSVMLKQFARVEKMAGPQKRIRALGFGTGRFLTPAGQFDESKYKKQFIQGYIQLNAKELRGCVVIFDSDLEDIRLHVSPEAYKATIMQMVTKKIAIEMEEMGWISDTAGLNGFAPDDARSLFDGWRYRIVNSQAGQAYINAVTGSATLLDACDDTSGAPFDLPGLIAEQSGVAPYNWEFKYGIALKNMPSAYKQMYGLPDFAFLNSDLVTQDYMNALSARSTAIGDGIFLGTLPTGYNKVKIIDVPLMPTNLGSPLLGTDGIIGGGNYTDCLLTHKGNLIVGIQLEIALESERKAADRATYVFYTLKVDFAVENVNACVLIRCLEHNC
jgi:hypothetical protein